jgi:hypothetical protein
MKFLVFLFKTQPNVRCDMQSYIQSSARMRSANNSKMGANGAQRQETESISHAEPLTFRTSLAAQKLSKLITEFPSPVPASMFNVGATHLRVRELVSM